MAQRNVRLPLRHVAGRLHDPIRYSDFSGQGRAVVAGAAHVPVYTASNIAEIQAVQEDFFKFPKVPSTNLTKFAAGMHAPLVERANIFRPEAMAYGSQYTVNPPQR
jgi:hypothetical protein